MNAPINPFKRLDTVTVTGTDIQGIVIDTYIYQNRAYAKVRVSREMPDVSYEIRRLTRYEVQPCDTIFYMDDAGIMWPYEVLDLTADGLNVIVAGHNGIHTLFISTATMVLPASMTKIRRIMESRRE